MWGATRWDLAQAAVEVAGGDAVDARLWTAWAVTCGRTALTMAPPRSAAPGMEACSSPRFWAARPACGAAVQAAEDAGERVIGRRFGRADG